MRRAGRADQIVAAIVVRDRLGMNKAVLDTALDRDGFGLGDERAAVSSGAGLDKRATASVLDDELVTVNLCHLALDRDRAPLVHGRDRRRGEDHESRLPALQRDGRHAAADRERADKGGGRCQAPLAGSRRRDARRRSRRVGETP